MPTFIRRLTPSGLEPLDYSAELLAEAASHEPDDGIYTVTNTFETFKVLKFDAHLNRMEDSARRADIPLMLDRPRLKTALREMIAEAGFGDVRFRVTVPREQPDTFIISLEPFKPLSQDVIATGVRVITVPNSGRNNPAAKTTDWMHQREKIVKSLAPGVYDAILLDESGDLLEGLGANFYAVKDGVLRTAGEGVLPGIAQQIVFEIAPPILSIERKAVNVRDLAALSEAFITSSSRGIVPIVEIDGQRIGAGVPGEKTLALRTAYQGWVDAHLENL